MQKLSNVDRKRKVVEELLKLLSGQLLCALHTIHEIGRYYNLLLSPLKMGTIHSSICLFTSSGFSHNAQ